MLRWKEKQDVEARYYAVDDLVERWKSYKVDASEALDREFNDRLLISLIYHDSALEGDVISYGEIKAAIDQNIISDTSLIPAYEDTKNFYAACSQLLEQAKNKKKSFKLETIKEIHTLVAPAQAGASYRKENPLHRLYYHEIAAPDKIAQRMRKFGEWFESATCKALHPIQRAAEAHWEFMAIFPWLKHSGQVARIMSNYLLRHAGYPMAVIHSIDRQRYYEALKTDVESLLLVYLEAVEATASAAIRVYQEAAGRHAS